MVVDERVERALREASDVVVRAFVAGCAERMAQLFTGFHAAGAAREADADLLLRVLDDLWDVDQPGDAFGAAVASLEAFPELEPGDDELVDVADTYSFYAVLVAHHACAYRAATADVEAAVRTAHVALTAMGLLDQNLSAGGFMAGEHERQSRAAHVDRAGGMREIDLRRLRAEDQKVSRERLIAVRDRLVL